MTSPTQSIEEDRFTLPRDRASALSDREDVELLGDTLDSSSSSSEEESTKELNQRNYTNSTFPSLLDRLGPHARSRRSSRVAEHADTSQKKSARHIPVAIVPREKLSFAEEMRQRNEVQWMRIEAVAKDKMAKYERYAVDMTLKIRKQRQQINTRSQQLLQSLAHQEEQKKETKIYDSSHGRIWRHHRSMQRRGLGLEPMSGGSKSNVSSGRHSRNGRESAGTPSTD